MRAQEVHRRLLWILLSVTLTWLPPPAFPAPESRTEALAALKHAEPPARAEAVAWVAMHGRMSDQPLLIARLRDEDETVRALAEQGLWLLWSRSGDATADRLLAAGTEHMQAGRLEAAIAAFSEVIRRRPAFAEGWNKRATARYLDGDYQI